MAWTTPRDWTASELVTASIMNTHVRDNLVALRAAGLWTDDCILYATKKLSFDGSLGGSNDTYITERAANILAIYANNNKMIDISDADVAIFYDVKLSATKKLYLDGGTNTYLMESSADVIAVYAGGTNISDFTQTYLNHKGDLYIPSTKRVYFDGGTDTYIEENSANTLRCVAGGSGGVDLTNGATSWAAVSDERLKVILAPIANGAAKVASLRPVIGRFRDDAADRRRSFLIAQDVQRVLPEAVTEGEDGMLRLSYTDVVPLLVAAIQEQDARLAALTQEMDALKQQVAALAARGGQT